MHRMTQLPLLWSLLALALAVTTGCGGPTPEEQISIKLDEFRQASMEVGDLMQQLKAGQISGQEMEQRLREETLPKMERLENEIHTLIGDHRSNLSDDEIAVFRKQLEDYKELAMPTVPDSTSDGM